LSPVADCADVRSCVNWTVLKDATLASIDAVRVLGAKRVGFVTPYIDDVQTRIGQVWKQAGIICHAERHLNLRDNFSFGEVQPRRSRR
jgi:maleate isomerase